MANDGLTFVDVEAPGVGPGDDPSGDASADDAYWRAVVDIRQQVFVVEQSCPPEEEFDAHDAVCRHVLGLAGGLPVATARWRPVERDGRRVAKLERFAVLAEHRGGGHGIELVRRVMDAATTAGHPTLYIHAQEYLRSFYEALGFEVCGERFDEAGIAHLPMICTPAVGPTEDADQPDLHHL